MACSLQDGAHRVYVDLRREDQPSPNVSVDRLSSHLHPGVKVVLRPAGHDAVEAVNRVRHAILRGEKRGYLFRVCEVRLDCHGIHTRRCLRFSDIHKNQVDV